MTNPTIHKILPASSTPPGMVERLPNVVQYPASTSYCKYSKANCNPPTPVPEKYSKKVNFSGSSKKTKAQCYQPYTNITKGEAQPQNNNQSHAKMSVGNSLVGSRSLKRNRWDVKDAKCVKSSKYGREMKVDCIETSRPLYNNESNSNSLFGNNTHKTEKTIVKLERGDGDPSSYVKSKEKPVHSPSDALLNTVKAEWSDQDPECLEISEKKENYIDEYLRDNIDVVDDDDADDDLNDKDADELLMSMSNRSIKINRLLEEQKRLMATVSFVKHTPLVDDQSGYTL